MNGIEQLLRGALSSLDSPEVRISWVRRKQQYSCRIYASNRTKTGHGTGATVSEAISAAVASRMGADNVSAY